MILRNCMFRLSMAFVVYTTRLISGYSLIGTCEVNRVESYRYFCNLFAKRPYTSTLANYDQI
jgi:hypothetical protein